MNRKIGFVTSVSTHCSLRNHHGTLHSKTITCSMHLWGHLLFSKIHMYIHFKIVGPPLIPAFLTRRESLVVPPTKPPLVTRKAEFNGGPTKLSLLDKKEHFSGPPATKPPLLNKKAEFSGGGPTKSPLLVDLPLPTKLFSSQPRQLPCARHPYKVRGMVPEPVCANKARNRPATADQGSSLASQGSCHVHGTPG